MSDGGGNIHDRVLRLEVLVDDHESRLNNHDAQIGRLIGVSEKHDLRLKRLEAESDKALAISPVRRRRTVKRRKK